MTKTISSTLTILVLLLSGINCSTGIRGGSGGDASPSMPNRADVLETAVGVLRAAGYEISTIDKDKGHISATKGSVEFTLLFVDKPKLCTVHWTINKNKSSPHILNTESKTMSCVGFRPELEKALGID